MKILIVDDEPLIRRSLARAFQTKGWQISEASDGVEGLALWQKLRPDVVLLDVLMPGLTGPQVLESVPPEMKKNCRVLMMSAFTGDWNQSKAEEIGAEAFLPKPFDDIFEIVARIELKS